MLMWRGLLKREIKCHPLYYDEQGNFHVERRLGCIGCPLKADNGKAEYKLYPKMLKARIRAHARFIQTHPDGKTVQYFGHVYNATFFQMFCKNLEEYRLKISPDLWGSQLDTKKFLEDYFNVEL